MAATAFWPTPSHPSVFVERRRRLRQRLSAPALLAAGWARPKNFPNNPYPFRAESHFLFLVGRHIEGAALVLTPDSERLYAPAPDPEDALWHGPSPALEDLGRELGLDVRPLEELGPIPGLSMLPPQDGDSAAWLSELFDRDIEPGGGDRLEGPDADLADAMIALRLYHDAAGVAQLRQAAEVTAAAFSAAWAATRPGIREASVRAAMEAAIIARGMRDAYEPIVTVRGDVLHNHHHDKLLHAGDLLLADVGAETPEGYAADVTRTWPVSGRFSPSQRAIYDLVLEAQRAAIAAVRPGVRFLEVHRIAGRTLLGGLIDLGVFRGGLDELYERGAAALLFPHGVGHLLGLDVHDMEDLGDRAGYAPGRERPAAFGDRYLRLDRDLAPGMVVTIEPGLYFIDALLQAPSEVGDLESSLDRERLSAFSDVRGIRIEDDVLVTATGAEVLTGAIPKAAEALER